MLSVVDLTSIDTPLWGGVGALVVFWLWARGNDEDGRVSLSKHKIYCTYYINLKANLNKLQSKSAAIIPRGFCESASGGGGGGALLLVDVLLLELGP